MDFNSKTEKDIFTSKVKNNRSKFATSKVINDSNRPSLYNQEFIEIKNDCHDINEEYDQYLNSNKRAPILEKLYERNLAKVQPKKKSLSSIQLIKFETTGKSVLTENDKIQDLKKISKEKFQMFQSPKSQISDNKNLILSSNRSSKKINNLMGCSIISEKTKLINHDKTSESELNIKGNEKSQLQSKISFGNLDICPVIYMEKVGNIYSFAATSYKNLSNENYEKISISLKMNVINKEKSSENVEINYLGIYDGFLGSSVSGFLKENLHKFICYNREFFKNIPSAISKGFKKAEELCIQHLINLTNESTKIDRSASNALISMFLENKVYIANLGDSRCFLSKSKFSEVIQMTKDHKCYDEIEKTRITNFGGTIIEHNTLFGSSSSPKNGVFRTNPGKLDVSRILGSLEAKENKYGGSRSVILYSPDIIVLNIEADFDFLLMGSDGLFDSLSNRDITKIIMKSASEHIKNDEKIQQFLNNCSKNLIGNAIARGSKDSISCLLILFETFYNNYLNKDLNYFEENRNSDQNGNFKSIEKSIIYQKFIEDRLDTETFNNNKILSKYSLFKIKKYLCCDCWWEVSDKNETK